MVDLEPSCEASAEHEAGLAEVVGESMFEPTFFASLADDFGWSDARELFIAPRTPTVDRVKRGDFGEALAGGILQQCYGYGIPVHKLRFKVSANQTLPGTDILALKLDPSGEVSEVCYVEVKLRTKADSMAAVKGYEQLLEDYHSRLPSILAFVAARLSEGTSSMVSYSAFRAYLRDRRDTTNKDTFVLNLCWDRDVWRESVLENLRDNGVRLPRLTVQALRVADLKNLSDKVFATLGASEVIDDE